MRGSTCSPPPPYSPLPQPTLYGSCDTHGPHCQCHGSRAHGAPMEPLQLQQQQQREGSSPQVVYGHMIADHPLWHPPPCSRLSSSPTLGLLESTTNLTDDQLATRGCGCHAHLHQPQPGPYSLAQPASNHLNSQVHWYRKYCNHQVPAVVVFGVVAAVFSVTYLYMVVVYRLQPSPVVDEAFHIPQAQKYCQGKFNEWDPKLTTLPGLYLFSIGITGPISWLLGSSPQQEARSLESSGKVLSNLESNFDSPGRAAGSLGPGGSLEEPGVCSVLMLRLVNVVVAPCTLLALHSLMCLLHGGEASEWSCLAASVTLVLLPPLFWFYSLYYTEPLSTMMVLLMLLLHCRGNHSMAAAIGGVSVLVRQTNVVWVLFLLLLRGTSSLLRLLGGAPPLTTLHTLDHCKTLVRRLQRVWQGGPRVGGTLVLGVAGACGPYLLLLGAFGAFVWVNGGLVVGDRAAHTPTLHLMQLCYFCLFYVLFSPVLALDNLADFLGLCCRHPKRTCALLACVAGAVRANTLVHPYLLADNRHYTFYLWNRLYARHASFRYVVAPLYVYGAHLVWNVSLARRSHVWRALYVACAALCLVPQRLLEPRYFVLPFLVARAQLCPSFGPDPPQPPQHPARLHRAPFVDGDPRGAAPVRGGPRGGATPRGGGARRGVLRHAHAWATCARAAWRQVRQRVQRVRAYVPGAHLGWEFLYYLTINLAALAIFASKTFWWEDMAEPQRIMW